MAKKHAAKKHSAQKAVKSGPTKKKAALRGYAVQKAAKKAATSTGEAPAATGGESGGGQEFANDAAVLSQRLPHALDPKLRRLTYEAHEPARLRQDLDRGFLAVATSLVDEAVPLPTEVTKRVLVLLDQDRVPEELGDLRWNAIVGNTYVVTVPVSRLEELGSHPEVRYVEAGRILTTSLDTSLPETRANLVHRPPLELRGDGVIVGIIDVGGLDFSLDDFRRPDGSTRLLILWDQRLTRQGGERSPDEFNYGVEYDEDDINLALGQSDPLQALRHNVSPGSHATHVASIAAGNEHVFRGHASGTLASGQSSSLRWKVGGGLPWPGVGTLQPGPAGDRTRNELEIWYSSQDRMRVTVTSPGGESVGPVEPGETEDQALLNGNRVFIDSVRFSPLNGDSQIYVEVSPAPGGTVQSGEWHVRLEAIESRHGRFDAWIERDARVPGNSFADQSFFVGTDFDPTMTLGTPATGRRSIVVANYDHRTESPERSSGRGPTRDGRPKPEVAAPGTTIFAAHALGGRPGLPAGNYPMRDDKTGTSMAAPHVAGIVALMLQRDRRLTAAQIRKILIAGSRPVAGASNFDPAWGFGRVDAESAVNLVP